MVAVTPDWQRLWTRTQMEVELRGFQFKGPGLYLTATDTLLVVPEVDGFNWSASGWPVGQLFRVYCWNCPIQHTIFGTSAPVHKDTR